MMDNNLYNLMEQLIIESRSLWKIKNDYKKNAEECRSCLWSIAHPPETPDCPACLAFWKELEKQKEENIRKLESLVRDHMNGSRMSKPDDILTDPK